MTSAQRGPCRLPVLRGADPVERFWSKVDRSGGPDACWPWLGSTCKDGYGKFQTGPRGKQKHHRAHRYALEITVGGSGECVLHSCDTPACCNPKHLRWGTTLENVADRVAKGRTAKGDRHSSVTRPERVPRGERHGMAKLTNAQVRLLRAMYAKGTGPTELARVFGLHPTTASAIARGKVRRSRPGERLAEIDAERACPRCGLRGHVADACDLADASSLAGARLSEVA